MGFSQVLIDEPVNSSHASLLSPWQYSPKPFYKEGWTPTLPFFFTLLLLGIGSRNRTGTRAKKFLKTQTTCLLDFFSIECRHCGELFAIALVYVKPCFRIILDMLQFSLRPLRKEFMTLTRRPDL